MAPLWEAYHIARDGWWQRLRFWGIFAVVIGLALATLGRPPDVTTKLMVWGLVGLGVVLIVFAQGMLVRKRRRSASLRSRRPLAQPGLWRGLRFGAILVLLAGLALTAWAPLPGPMSKSIEWGLVGGGLVIGALAQYSLRRARERIGARAVRTPRSP